MRSVSLVVGRGSGQPHEEVTGSLGLAHRSTCFCLPCGGKLRGGGGRMKKREESGSQIRGESGSMDIQCIYMYMTLYI